MCRKMRYVTLLEYHCPIHMEYKKKKGESAPNNLDSRQTAADAPCSNTQGFAGWCLPKLAIIADVTEVFFR